MNTKNNYTADQIKIYEGVRAVQKRPGMYLGSTDSDGFHHMVWEIVDNALDEYLAGFCDTIWITIKKNNTIIIEDNGRGIPPEIHKKTGFSTIETVFTSLHAGGKFDSQVYQVSGGLHGVGATVVNAMSEHLKVEVVRDKKKYTINFKNGHATKEGLETTDNVGEKKPGTLVQFTPNIELFDDAYTFNSERIAKRIQETAYINNKVRIIFNDEINNISKEYYYENGIVDFLNSLTSPALLINQHEKTIFGNDMNDTNKISARFIFRYSTAQNANILSFCNNIKTYEGGVHVQGFKKAITWTTRKIIKQFKAFPNKEEDLRPEDCMSGLVAILAVLHPDPKFAGQTKTKLVNSETSSVIYKIVSQTYEKFLLEHPEDRRLIFSKVLRSYNMRIEIEKKIKEIKEKDKIFENSTLPGKLADCSSKIKEEKELYLVEGDSAGGSAKLGRNREFQAILPLKGKIINSEKTSEHKLFANEEISDLISSIGFTFRSIQELNAIDEESANENTNENEVSTSDTSNENNNKKAKKTKSETIGALLRYHKIIIMTDADVDGSHIAVLLLTFFYRFFPQLIENGYIYLAQPPLYKLKVGKRVQYFYEEETFKTEIKKLGDQKFEIQRYKGLGEMNPGQLWETTMDPKSRTLKQVFIEDVASSNNIIELLMGKEVEGRKKFIIDSSEFVNATELDI